MIDWHTHILPGMDDGSRDVAESISLIKMQVSQGIDTVVATPHFYANDETINSFLDRRKKSLELLKSELPDTSPKILLGAEVRYYQGISRMADLNALRIEDSKLILLEMPMSTWTEYMIRELIEMSGRGEVKIVLAHVDRYLNFQKAGVLERIFKSGILIQANASFFNDFSSKRKALAFLRKGNIHFVGSDCHNIASRPPQIGKAFDIIKKKFGKDYLQQMNEYGYSLLEIKNN